LFGNEKTVPEIENRMAVLLAGRVNQELKRAENLFREATPLGKYANI
jgi:hypothetical protein